jgi:uncharacterized integral membrane protein (TIGR00698 family)
MSLISSAADRNFHSAPARVVERFLPGIVLVLLVTAAAYGLRQLPLFSSFSPMITAIFVGMTFSNVLSVSTQALPGIGLMGKKLLRLAVALLGLQLTFSQVAQVGADGMLLLVAVVAGTYVFTVSVGRLLGVDMRLARLLAAGTSICGASAVAAANTVERCEDEDVAYAVACVTLFGTVATLVYPLLASAMEMTPLSFGFWTGVSIHEVAQVVAAGFQQGTEAGEFAVVVKLSRVLLLAPLLIAMTLLASRRSTSGGDLALSTMVPVFVAGFILLMLANSAGLVPDFVRGPLVTATPMMLTAALGALGLGTRFGALRIRGFRPLVLAALAWLFIGSASLLLLPNLA